NGRRIAEVLKPFRTRIIATDIFPQDQPDSVDELWPADQLDQLLAESDAVILCVPLNDQTHHMITARELGLMKRDAFLINVARGPVVAEADLARSLAEDELAGAGLDVTEIEPLPEDSPLWDLPNIIITPHVGAQSARRVDCSTALFCENIARFEQGKPLRNLVDKSLGFPRPEHRS
ncbi:MAG: D-2-hydroxyacid dehydrogenase, partial [bacterium]|nr:D-2-hydroxyacid dehydrogenase [bacterium]